MIRKSIKVKYSLYGEEYKIQLDFRDTKAIIMGDSGSGKSLVYQIIERELNLGNIEAVCYNTKSIESLKRELSTGSFQFSNKLVILDNADILISKVPELIDAVNLNHSNVYLIFARVAKGIDASPNVCGELEYKDNTFSIKYMYPEGMWA